MQSVALRLVVDREAEIEKHRAQPYWSVNVLLAHADGTEFSAALTAMNGMSLALKRLRTEADAEAVAARLRATPLEVLNVGMRVAHRYPPRAFSTSTLQQEASRKLGLSPAVTMQTAQLLYEGDVNNGLWRWL